MDNIVWALCHPFRAFKRILITTFFQEELEWIRDEIVDIEEEMDYTTDDTKLEWLRIQEDTLSRVCRLMLQTDPVELYSCWINYQK